MGIRIKALEEMVKNILTLKISELEVKEKESETKIENIIKHIKVDEHMHVRKPDVFMCHKCKEGFKDRITLIDHIKLFHEETFLCNICDKKFETRWKLESHLKEHDILKESKCDICNKEFFLKWRLDQHSKGHSEENRKFCHFFNNGKYCTYEENGCKFIHEISRKCQIYRCQFNHDLEEENNREQATAVNFENLELPGKHAEEETVEIDDNKNKDTLDKVNKLEKDNKKLQDKLKLYSAAIKKLRAQN